MRMIDEEQLDFEDLMMQPKRSTLNSRSEVSLFREFKWFGHDGKICTLECIPIIIANMATIATPKMAKIAAKRGFMCALEKHFGGRRLYSTSEGREKLVPVVGSINSIFDDIEGGLKSAMTYIGAKKLKNIPKNCTFYKVRRQLNMVFDKCRDITV